VSTGAPFPAGTQTLAVRWTGYANFELVYNGQILLLDTYFDRGSMYPPLGFKAADVKRADAILIGHGHFDHMSDAASIALRKPANRNLAVSLTAEQFRYGFGNVLSGQESAELYDRWAVPSPGKPLFEAALANFTPQSPAKVNTANKTRGPLLLTAGGKDHTVPAAITTSTRKLYHKSPAITDFIEFPDRGHSLTIDHGWREVAQAALDWLRQRSL
jgi:pimeloyl-ACP methyl ester carboxylesterase